MKHLRLRNRLTRPFAAMLIALVAFAVSTSPIRQTAYAAAPVNAISYQGRLLDPSGNPVSDASAEFVFRFYGSLAGIDCLWESDDATGCDAGDETQTVAINDGLFSENIGSSVDPDGLSEAYPFDLSDVFENNSNVYLEVEINGEALSPRKQIVAAPFALNSQSLDGLDSTDFLSNTGDTATGVYDFTGATIFGGSALSFDGATAGNGFESTFAFDDPTADRTITFQDLDGTVALLSDIPAGSALWETDATSTFEDDGNVFIGSPVLGAVDASFVPDGDDLYVAGDIAAQFDVYADKFVAGDASTTFEDGAITTVGATDLALSIAGGDLTFGQDTVLGDGGFAISIDSTAWSVDAAGAASFGSALGVTGTSTLAAINASGNLTMTGASNFNQSGSTGTFATGTGAVTLNGNSTVATGKTLVLTDLTSTLLKTNGSGTIVAATAGTDYLTGALADNNVLIGNGAGVATAVTLSGDVTSTNAGVLTIGSGKVNSDKIINDTIVDADISSSASIALSKLASGSSIVTSLAPPSGSSANGGSIAANVLTLSLADGTNPGLVSTGSQTFAGDKTFSGALTANGTVAIGDNGDTVAINSSDWDVDASGVMTGIAMVSSNANQPSLSLNVPVTGTDATSHFVSLQIDGNDGVRVTATGDGAGSVGDRIIDIGKTLGTDTVNIGDAASSVIIGAVGANVALTDSQWSISGIGTATFADDLSVGGTTPSASPFGVDESTNTAYIGEGSGSNGTLAFKASDADAGNVAYTTDDLWAFTGGNVFIGATSVGSVKSTFAPNGDDLYVEGDIAAQFNMYADSFTAGDASTTFADGSITTGADLSLAIVGGDLTFAQNTVVGDGGDVLSINSSDWDIGTTGNMTGIGSITADGDYTTSGDANVNGGDLTTTAATFNVANAATTLNLGSTNIARTVNLGSGTGIDTINIGTGGTAIDVIRIGDGIADVAVADANWSISNLGTATFAAISSTSMSGDLNMGNNVITNIGNALTDFTGTGGLTLAGTLTANGAVDINGVATFNADTDLLLGGTENLQLTSTTGASSVNAFAVRLENTDAVGAGTQRGMYVTNESNATTATTESLITLDNLDSDILTDALNISSTGTITDAIDASAANIVNAMNVGANTFLGTTAIIDFTNFDVASTGSVTVAAGQGIDTNGAGALTFGNTNATSASFCNSAACDTIQIGTNADADAITIGDLTDTLTLNSGAGTINFDEFDVSSADGSVTINDVGGDAGKLLVEGTGLDMNSLDFVGVGTITTGGGSTLTLDSASGTIEGAVNDQFVVKAPGSSGPAGFEDSPSLTVRGTYFNGTTQNFNTTINTNMLTAGASPTATLDFNLNGTGVEMSVNEIGNLTAVGGATFGDGTNVDKFDFTSIATVTDILTVTANATVSQTAGSAMLIQRANNAGTNFTSTAGLFNVSMLDTTSSGDVSKFINEGTGSSIFVDANGNTGGTVGDSDGGAIHVSNTGNADYGLTVYTENGATTSANGLAYIASNNSAFDSDVLKISSTNDGVSGTAAGTAIHTMISRPSVSALGNYGTQAAVFDTTFDSGGADFFEDEAMIIVRQAVTSFDPTGTGDTTFRVDADGDVWADGKYNGVAFVVGTASDVAEKYPSDENLVAGEVIAFDPSGTNVQRSVQPYQTSVTGVISTDPGLSLAADTNGYFVALTGRVPTFVTDENGPIATGDPITSSSTAGYGMKATEVGTIVGFALEDYSGTGPGSISVFVSPQFYVGSVLATDGSATVVSDTLALGSTGTADATTTGLDSNAFELRGSGWDGGMAQSVQMSMATDVTSASDYRLSIKNTAGSEVAYVSQAGDMALSGRLYPSDRGTLQTSKYIYYDGSSGSGGDFMRTNASGWATGSYDFAEMFPSVDALEAGDVVIFGTSNESVLKSTGSSASLAGIVSTRPGFLAGENTAGHFPIALAGRVPTKVSLENGSIAIGDPLTASATKGYAMKATESGPIVGYALEAYSGAAGADDKVIAFVNAGYWAGGPVSPTPGTSNSASTIIVRQDADNLTTLNMEGNIYMAGNDILGVSRIAGLSDRWSLEEDGTIKTAAAFKTVIESYQGELVETTAVTSPDVQITLVGSATLENGEAVIRFEDASPSFNDVTSTTAPIRVIVTPNGPVSLYVYEKNNDGFGVRQMNGSDSGITFDWMVSAFRKDYEPAEAVVTDEPVVVDEPVVSPPHGEEGAGVVVETEPVVESADPAVEVTEPSVDETVPPTDSTESNSAEPEPAP